MLPLLFALTAPVLSPLSIPTMLPVPHASAAPVQVYLNGGDYRPGERVRVEIQTAEDGYLVVFRVDADGLIRVIFPLDPDLDAFVRGGKRYELRGRGDRETFLADYAGGKGLIYAAISPEPMDLGRYANGSHWDYALLQLQSDDAEAELSWFVRQLTSNGPFRYDAIGYRISGTGHENVSPIAVPSPVRYYAPYSPRASYGYGYPRAVLNISLGSRLGRSYYHDPYYDPWYGYSYSTYGYGSYDYRAGALGRSPNRHTSAFPPYTQKFASNTVYGTRARPRTPLAELGTFSDGVGGKKSAGVGEHGPAIGRTSDGVRGESNANSSRSPRRGEDRPQPVDQKARRGGGTTPAAVGREASIPGATRNDRPRRQGQKSAESGSTITQRRTTESSLAPAAGDRPATSSRPGSRATPRQAPPFTEADRPSPKPKTERHMAEVPVHRPSTAQLSTPRPPAGGNSSVSPEAIPRVRPTNRARAPQGEKAATPPPRVSVNRPQNGSAVRTSRSPTAAKPSSSARSSPSAVSTPGARGAKASPARGRSGGRSRGTSDR